MSTGLKYGAIDLPAPNRCDRYSKKNSFFVSKIIHTYPYFSETLAKKIAITVRLGGNPTLNQPLVDLPPTIPVLPPTGYKNSFLLSFPDTFSVRPSRQRTYYTNMRRKSYESPSSNWIQK